MSSPPITLVCEGGVAGTSAETPSSKAQEEQPMKKLKHALIGAAVLAGISVVSAAAATPIAGLATAVQDQSADLQNVRWVWVPGPACWRCRYWYRRPYWAGYRPYWRRPIFWGWRRRWWR
jgi:hypothetical protein